MTSHVSQIIFISVCSISQEKIHQFKAACLRTHHKRNHQNPSLNFPSASSAKMLTRMARCLTYNKKLKTNPFTQLSCCGWSEYPTSLSSRNLQIDVLMISTLLYMSNNLYHPLHQNHQHHCSHKGKLEIEGYNNGQLTLDL